MSSHSRSIKTDADPQLRPGSVEEEQRTFEQLVSDLAVRVVGANLQTLDSEIESALGRVGTYLELGLTTVLVRDHETGLFHHTHEWYDPRLFDGPVFCGTAVDAPHDWVVSRLEEGSEVLLSSVNDLPPEAFGEKETAKRLDIRSVLWVPIWAEEQVDGYVAFNSIGKERDWTDQIIHRLRLLAEILGAALTRRQKDAELETQLAFEHMVGELSSELAGVQAADLDSVLTGALHRLADYFGLDRAFFGLVRGDRLIVDHFWMNERLPEHQQQFVRDGSLQDLWIFRRCLEGHVVSVSKLEDLPEEAEFERQHYREQGLKSSIFVPGRVGRRVVGAVVLDSLSDPDKWPEAAIRRLTVPVDLLFNAVMRVRAEQELEQRLRFEALLAQLSQRLAAIDPEAVDAEIDRWLEPIAHAIDVEQIVLGTLSGQGDLASARLRTWCSDGVPRLLRSDEIPWVIQETLERARTVRVTTLDDLPPEAEVDRKSLQAMGIQSFVQMPLKCGNEIHGGIALSSFSRQRSWSDDLVSWIALIAEAIAAVLARRLAKIGLEQALNDSQEAEHRIRELSDFEHLVADLSAQLAAVKEGELDPVLYVCLEALAAFLGSERVFLWRFTEEGEHLRCTHLWTAKGISPNSSIFKLDLARDVPWVAEHVRQDGIIKGGPGLAGLPEAAQMLREQLERDGVTSGLVVPIFCEGEPAGMLGLDTIGHPRDYPGEIIERLRLLASVIGSTLRRLDRDTELRDLQSQLEKENISLRSEIQQHADRSQIVGESPVLQRLLHEATEVASTESTVLIQGETGTGKELLARFIHRASSRADHPLIKVDCATLPATLVESELFGRERGAYTGAMTRQVGRFEVADGATLFLDEIGEIPAETQVKLLRALEEGAFERLGSSKTVTVDVRVIAATNRDLQAEVTAGRFREDLFYRLNVFPMTVPPLRERPEDIPLLTWSMVQEFAAAMGKDIESISPECLSALREHEWPGNVRELRNVLERAVILSHGRVLEVDALSARRENRTIEPSASLDEAQRQHILRVLEQTGWRVRGKAGAAEILQLKPTTLEARMKKLGIQRPS